MTETINDSADATSEPLGDVAADIQAAVNRLREARQIQLALEPVRHLLADIDEQLREAVAYGEQAGMSQRALAAQSGVAQPTIKTMLDQRRGAIIPAPSLAEHTWALHQSATALTTLALRLLGQKLPRLAPTSGHVEPYATVQRAAESLAVAAKRLADAAAAMDVHAR